MKTELQDILRCPDCNADLSYFCEEDRAGLLPAVRAFYRCGGCGKEYPLEEGVLDFFPRRDGKRSIGQRSMEFEPIVRIYEGNYWRRSKVFFLFTRISLDEEMSLIQKVGAPGPGDTVLDLACGPGLYTRAFAEGGPERTVIGLDISWPMLKYASGRSRSQGLGNVAFLHGDAQCLPFKDSSFNAVNCTGALHLFPDRQLVLQGIHRVLKPRGRLSVGAFLDRGGSNPLARLDAYFDEKVLGIHSFQKGELCELLNQAGFVPTVHHARGFWIIAGGVKEEQAPSFETQKVYA